MLELVGFRHHPQYGTTVVHELQSVRRGHTSVTMPVVAVEGVLDVDVVVEGSVAVGDVVWVEDVTIDDDELLLVVDVVDELDVDFDVVVDVVVAVVQTGTALQTPFEKHVIEATDGSWLALHVTDAVLPTAAIGIITRLLPVMAGQVAGGDGNVNEQCEPCAHDSAEHLQYCPLHELPHAAEHAVVVTALQAIVPGVFAVVGPTHVPVRMSNISCSK